LGDESKREKQDQGQGDNGKKQLAELQERAGNLSPEQTVQLYKELRGPDGQATDTTFTLAPLLGATAQDWLGSNSDPDILLAVPNLGFDKLQILVEDIEAHVRVDAKLRDLLELHVGADVRIGKVDIELDNFRVQAMAKINLGEVTKIVESLVDLLKEHPEILTSLTEGVGKGVQSGLGGEHGVALEEVEQKQKGPEKKQSSEKRGSESG
jgi:hypothetical protein